MRIDYNKPEAKIYDLTVDGKPQGNWVSADEGTGEYEIFVEDVPWRGGGRMVDTDNPTGYQTLKQRGKVEFKRNDLPDPTGATFGESCWGNYCGAAIPFVGHPATFAAVNAELREEWDKLTPAAQQLITAVMDTEPIWPPALSYEEWQRSRQAGCVAADPLIPYSVTFSSIDGETWAVVENGEERDYRLRFTHVDYSREILFFQARITDSGDCLTRAALAPGSEPVLVTGRVTRPGLNWSHEMKGGVCHRSFTLTAHSEEHEWRGRQLFQWLDFLAVWIRQEAGLPV